MSQAATPATRSFTDPEAALAHVRTIYEAGIAHLAAGILMQLYCAARRLAGRMSAKHDIDIVNVTLYWHFAAIMSLITVALIAGFPLLS